MGDDQRRGGDPARHREQGARDLRKHAGDLRVPQQVSAPPPQAFAGSPWNRGTMSGFRSKKYTFLIKCRSQWVFFFFWNLNEACQTFVSKIDILASVLIQAQLCICAHFLLKRRLGKL